MEQELVWQEVRCVTRTSTATTRFEAVAISLELEMPLVPKRPMIKRSRRVRSRRTCKAESCGHCHQIGERVSLHLSHHLISLLLSSPPTCLFNRPPATKAMTCLSRGVSDA